MSASPMDLDLDSFPIGIAITCLRRNQAIAYASIYGVFSVILMFRQICHTRPRHRHRKSAYGMFVAMSLLRVVLFALGAALTKRLAAGARDNWGIVVAMDMLSIIGYAFFAAGAFSLAYSWSGRIPCLYCMVQFDDRPHWAKAAAVYGIPTLCAILQLTGSAVRSVAVHADPAHPNTSMYRSGSFTARAGVVASSVFAFCLIFIIPYTAWSRYRTRGTVAVDHTVVRDMIAQQNLHGGTLNSGSALSLLWLLGMCIVPGSLWRIMLVQTSQYHTLPWVRTPAALGVLTIMFEFLALLLASALDFDNLDAGDVLFWKPWQCKSNFVRSDEIESSTPELFHALG